MSERIAIHVRSTSSIASWSTSAGKSGKIGGCSHLETLHKAVLAAIETIPEGSIVHVQNNNSPSRLLFVDKPSLNREEREWRKVCRQAMQKRNIKATS